MVYKFFDKKSHGSGVKSTPQNKHIVDELHKPIIRKFYSVFIQYIWYLKSIFVLKI